MLDAGLSSAGLDDPFEPSSYIRTRRRPNHQAGFIDLGGSSVLQKTWRDHLSTEPVMHWTQPLSTP